MNRETILPKSFMDIAPAILCWILSVFLAANARADEKVHVAYISDSPGSSASYWIAQDAEPGKIQGEKAGLKLVP